MIPPEEDQYDQFGRPIVRQPAIQQADFSPIPIQPVAPMPAEAQQSQIAPLNPQDPQYKNSKIRTVLNAIAGGLAGAAAGPKVGYEIGSELHDAKFNRAQAQQDRLLNILKPQVESEKERRRVGEEQVKAGIQRGSAQSLSEKRISDADNKTRDIDVKERDQASKQKHREELGRYTEWKMDPKNAKKDDLQYLLDLPEEQQADALRMIKSMTESKQKSPEQIETESEARTKGSLTAQDTDLGRRVNTGKATSSTEGRMNAEENTATPKVIADYNQLKDKDPASAVSALRMMPAGARMKVMQQAGIPPTLSARAQERMLNSKITLGHVDSATRLATDPQIAKNLGAIAGRIEIIAGKIGTGEPTTLNYDKAIAGLNPSDQRKMGEFLNFLNYMVIWESTTLSGTRPAQRLIESLRETGARASMSQDRLLGALDAIKLSVKNTMNGIIPGSGDKKEAKSGIDWGQIKVVK